MRQSIKSLGINFKLPATGIAFIILIFIWLLSAIMVDGFATYNHTKSVLQTASFLGIAAAGETIVIMMSGIDISIPAFISLSAIFTAHVLGTTSLSTGVAAGLALLICAFIGFLNGVGIYWLKLHPLVMTFAMLSIIEGILLVFTNGTPPTGMTPALQSFSTSDWFFGLPNSVFIWLLVSIFSFWFLNKSRFGRHIYAIGTNPEAAYLSGVSIRNTTLIAYSISGLFGGLSGILLLGYLGSSYLTMGDPYMLTAIAAVVLGGTSILGGKGRYIGTIAGTLLLGLLLDLLSVINISQAGRDSALGVLLLLFLLAYGRDKVKK